VKVYIACSTGLKEKVDVYVAALKSKGHSVFNPIYGSKENLVTHDILNINLDAIKQCDEVHVIWDGSSYGTIFDLGNAYALHKPIKIIYAPGQLWLFYIKEHEGSYLK